MFLMRSNSSHQTPFPVYMVRFPDLCDETYHILQLRGTEDRVNLVTIQNVSYTLNTSRKPRLTWGDLIRI